MADWLPMRGLATGHAAGPGQVPPNCTQASMALKPVVSRHFPSAGFNVGLAAR